MGKKLGDDQFAVADRVGGAGPARPLGLGIEPGAADVFAKYAATHLFSKVDEVGVRDGANLEIARLRVRADVQHLDHDRGMPEPAGDLGEGGGRDGGWYTTAPFSEPEMFTFPGGIGDVECVNVEHEEVLLVPRWVDCDRVTFKYGLGDEFIRCSRPCTRLGLDRVGP